MEKFLKKLRNRKISTASFRTASREIGKRLALELYTLLKKRHVSSKNIVIVIILRSAIALLEPTLEVFPKALVGVLGIKRNEDTFDPDLYYENLPPFSRGNTIIILDPMLATGGSAEAAMLHLCKRGAKMENIYFLGIVGINESLARLARFIPKENIILAAIDKGLDAKKYIVPGLGDFGDRYFGYTDNVSFKKL